MFPPEQPLHKYKREIGADVLLLPYPSITASHKSSMCFDEPTRAKLTWVEMSGTLGRLNHSTTQMHHTALNIISFN